MIRNISSKDMKKKYVLIEQGYRDCRFFCRVVFESRFKTDVDITKIRYEAKKQKNTSYSIQEIMTNFA